MLKQVYETNELAYLASDTLKRLAEYHGLAIVDKGGKVAFATMAPSAPPWAPSYQRVSPFFLREELKGWMDKLLVKLEECHGNASARA